MNFPRHSGWEFQKHLLLYYLCSRCSPTGLMLLWLISEEFHRLQREHAEMAAESFEKHTLSPPPLCLRLVCKLKHGQMRSSSFCSVLYLASLGMVFLLVCTEQLCQPKVRDFHMLRSLNKDVPGSKVTVHQAPFLQIVHSLQYNTLLVRPRALRAPTHKSPNLTCFVVTTDTTMDIWQVMPPALSIYMMFIAGRG